MDSTVFKYNHQRHHRQQNQQFNTRSNSNSNSNNANNTNNTNNIITSRNYKNQNSIFILNTSANSILPNYSDFNDNNVLSPSGPSPAANTQAPASSVWSSASSNMCSPAAHALQKLFNCSSNSFKLNHGNCSGGIESKTLKTKSEILKKKSKFWKYLEGEANDKNDQRGIEHGEKVSTKSFKYKSKYWSKSYDNDNQNHQDLSELLEYSCSLCDNCRCMDCQIGYFDCGNSDDSSSEYSFELSAYGEEDGDDDKGADIVDNERPVELKISKDTDNCLQATYENCCNDTDCRQQRQQDVRKLEIDALLSPNCNVASCNCNELNCNKIKCCQHCCVESIERDEREEVTAPHH